MLFVNGKTANVTIEQETIIDQLWYTWSHKGLAAISAGYRIRAASEGLHDVHNIRVQSLDRYQRYQLPHGVDPGAALSPRNTDDGNALNIAPICLSLIDAKEERILVHKVYTGRDAVGRYGVFFIHLLAGLPQDFSAKQAIRLWDSQFWQHSDATLRDSRTTLLDQVMLEQVMKTGHPLRYNEQDSENIKKYLPYVIHAYLTKKLLEERTDYASRQLYIAAPDEGIARLIEGLTVCLPERLLTRLTFSTYERAPEEATTEIVGTCWLSVADAKYDPNVTQLFPDSYYREKLALNCYNNKFSPLADNPIVEQLAEQATVYYVESIERKKHSLEGERFSQFLLEAQNCESVKSFLELYQKFALVERLIIPQDDVRTSDISYPQNTAQTLSVTFRSPVDRVREVMLSVIEGVEREVVSGSIAKQDSTHEIVTLEQLIEQMKIATPPATNNEAWIELLLRLISIENIHHFFFNNKHHWDSYTFLLGTWSIYLPAAKEKSLLLAPLLVPTWEKLGEFLQLHVPLSWTMLGIKTLVFDETAVLRSDEADRLAEKYGPTIENVFLFMQDEADDMVRGTLFSKLVTVHYRGKMNILLLLLDSHKKRVSEPNRDANKFAVEWLLEVTRPTLTQVERAQIFEDYVMPYLQYYPDSSILLHYVKDFFEDYLTHRLHISNALSNEPVSLQYQRELVATSILTILTRLTSLGEIAPLLVAQDDPLVLFREIIAILVTRCEPIAMLGKIASFCIKDENAYMQIMHILERELQSKPSEVLLFFYAFTISIGEGIALGRHMKPLFLPCILSADTLKKAFPQKEQEAFMQIFFTALLQHTDKTARNELLAQLGKQYSAIASRWRKAIEDTRYQSRPALAPVNKMRFWWETKRANAQLCLSHLTNNQKRIAQLHIEHMTSLEKVEDITALERSKLAVTANLIKASKQRPSVQAPEKNSKLKLYNLKRWWKREKGFVSLRLALVNGSIGQLVGVVTEQNMLLNEYRENISYDWWQEFDLAFSFFQAYETASFCIDEKLERAIIDTSQEIKKLAARQSTLHLSEHEEVRVKLAHYYVREYAPQAEDMGLADRKWMLDKLASYKYIIEEVPTEPLKALEEIPTELFKLSDFRKYQQRFPSGQGPQEKS